MKVLLVLACWLLPAAWLTASLTEEEVKGLFEEGAQLFAEANERHAKEPEDAKEIYEKAALRFERVVREGGVENGKLYYNIGNAYFRAGDLGRAILNYRRAEQFDPSDSNVKQNLEFARSQRKDELKESEEARILQTLLFFHFDLSFQLRVLLFGGAFLLLWVAAGVRLLVKRPFLTWLMGGAGVVSLVLLISLVAEALTLENERPGVVVAEEVVARKGDSASYEASFQEPLHAGAEFVLLEERNDWMHVKLPGDAECWLPARAVELVR